MVTHAALGIMSGSSIDGLYLAFCEFTEKQNRWAYRIVVAETLPYPEEWKMILQESYYADGKKLTENDVSYGKYLGEKASDFLKKH